MGRVYRAHDTTLGRDVAIKLLETTMLHGPERTQQRERFVREARAAARLLHPNIAVVHDVDPDAGWLVMELVEGESLRAMLARGPLPPVVVASILEQVLAALDAAHAAGVIHRDIKPSNIMLAAGQRVKLVDFGVARIVDAMVTRTGDHLGTPAYMAPEQIRGAPVDARTDLYSLGATAYELVTGDRVAAFESPGPATLARLAQACGDERRLAEVIARCLQGDPADRYPSARDALAALAAAAPVARVPAPVRRGRSRRAAVAVAIGVAVAAAGGAYALEHRHGARDPRVAKAFLLAQRGESDKALELLGGYLAEHPRDGDAQTIAFLASWWRTGDIASTEARATDLPLSPAQRAMIAGIDLITKRREPEAIAYLEAAARETPDAVEILYALGEAQWHGQHLEDGATTLARAFELDPRWEIALHHVVEYRLSRGETDRLAPIAAVLRVHDPAEAATLDCQIATSERAYPRAIAGARAALARGDVEAIPELYICLAQAQALAGDLDGGMATAKIAFDLWPIDTREWGGFAQYAEFLLYRGDLDGYLALVASKPSRQRVLALMYWRPTAPFTETAPSGPGMREPPIGAASWILERRLHHVDVSDVYATYPEPEVRDWGIALAAEARGARGEAIAALRDALVVPAKGDMRMLVAHRLAKLLHDAGDDAGAAAACDEVIRPRLYVMYRAVLLPDCRKWTARPSSPR
jgi:tetratricopeptide (TPR) repeat protein